LQFTDYLKHPTIILSMLSLIICSINPGHLEQVTESITASIGVEFELLVWDNREQGQGLCEIYNKLATKARFPFICFLHEDILFESPDWGSLLVKLFANDPEVGVIGVAGSKYKSRMYSGWYTGVAGLDSYYITHRTNGEDHTMVQPKDEGETAHEVVCIDGVLMACRKSIWEKVKFDEQLLKGFHFYDIDFSLRSAVFCKVVVTTAIHLVHITTGGDYGDRWIDAAILYHQKYRHALPYFKEPPLKNNPEVYIASQWLDRLKTEKISFVNRLKWIVNQKLFRHPSLGYSILKFIIYKPLHLAAVHRYFVKFKQDKNKIAP
jgi:hypothetical protein